MRIQIVVEPWGKHGEVPRDRQLRGPVARYDRGIGGLAWAAPQEMMCEDAIIYGVSESLPIGRSCQRLAGQTGWAEMIAWSGS